MTRRKERRSSPEDEPEIDTTEEDWVEFGGELYWAAGETDGGAPYGLTLAEYRAAMEEGASDEGWARAKRLLRRASSLPEGSEPHVGRVIRIGGGLSRDAFAAEVTQGHRSMTMVVLLPRTPDAERDRRTRREAALLARLAPRELPFRVPRPIAVLPTPLGLALVLEHMDGFPVDLRAGRTHRVRPWELVGELAAAVHSIPIEVAGELDGHATRRAHGEARLGELAELEHDPEPLIRTALTWLRHNLPPDEPAVLLHGDLLGQNILLPIGGEPCSRPALIDWEHALIGDPAYDLAIVTRGVRKPFQLPDGFEKMMGAYRAVSPSDARSHEVRFHELCILLRWYSDPATPGEREQHSRRIRNVLELVRRGSPVEPG